MTRSSRTQGVVFALSTTPTSDARPTLFTRPIYTYRSRARHETGSSAYSGTLQDAYQLTHLVDITWTLVRQAAYAARDRDLIATADRCIPVTASHLAWLRTHLSAAAPQTLLVAT